MNVRVSCRREEVSETIRKDVTKMRNGERRMGKWGGYGGGEWGWRMGNGEWGMENGEWRTGNGERGMKNGEWGMENEEWETGNGERGMRFLTYIGVEIPHLSYM